MSRPIIPPEIAPAVTAIVGLDSSPVAHPHIRRISAVAGGGLPSQPNAGTGDAFGSLTVLDFAKRAVISISGSDDVLHVAIKDDGHGFDPDQARGKGLGLISMEERVRHLGGTFSISPKPGDGTRIDIRIPLETEPAVVATESSTP